MSFYGQSSGSLDQRVSTSIQVKLPYIPGLNNNLFFFRWECFWKYNCKKEPQSLAHRN